MKQLSPTVSVCKFTTLNCAICIMLHLSLRQPTLLLAAAIALLPFTRADYDVDDANTTALLYSINPSASAKWGPFGPPKGENLNISVNGAPFPVNNTACYDATL